MCSSDGMQARHVGWRTPVHMNNSFVFLHGYVIIIPCGEDVHEWTGSM